jgi:hypothetical protein
MNWLSLLGAMAKLAGAIASALRDGKLLAAGEAKGRAASDADHARAAAAQGERMRTIAERRPARGEVEKRLEEGSA